MQTPTSLDKIPKISDYTSFGYNKVFKMTPESVLSMPSTCCRWEFLHFAWSLYAPSYNTRALKKHTLAKHFASQKANTRKWIELNCKQNANNFRSKFINKNDQQKKTANEWTVQPNVQPINNTGKKKYVVLYMLKPWNAECYAKMRRKWQWNKARDGGTAKHKHNIPKE